METIEDAVEPITLNYKIPEAQTGSGVILPGTKEFGAALGELGQSQFRTSVGFTPVLDRILVREIRTEAQLKLVMRGGFKLDLAQKDQRESFIGEVVGIGDGVPMGGVLVPMPFKLGDVVQYGRYGKEEIILNAEDEFDSEAPDYFLIRVADTKGIWSAR
jgi:co-chaperonin GroES (HSP10)